MTDIAKALAFARECLKWTDVKTLYNGRGTLIYGTDNIGFYPDNLTDLQPLVEQFLGERYFIQINRGKTGLFHWQVIVGMQDLSARRASWEHALAEGEDLWDCIFDGCVRAAQMFEKRARLL